MKKCVKRCGRILLTFLLVCGFFIICDAGKKVTAASVTLKDPVVSGNSVTKVYGQWSKTVKSKR